MAELRMDVGAMQSVSSQMMTSHELIFNEVTKVRALLEANIGNNWIGPGADQFKNDFNNWGTGILQTLDNMHQLVCRLENEISEWESTGQNIS